MRAKPVEERCNECGMPLDREEELVCESCKDTIRKYRKLSRYEQLEGLADRLCDTWDEYYGRI